MITLSRDVELLRVHLEDGEPVLVTLGNADVEGSLESTRAKERRVELRAEVGGAHHEHHLLVHTRVSLGVEAVELDEELQQTGLAFLRGAVHVAVESARAADGVELVDEDDRRRHLPRALEQVSHPLRRDAHEHLDKLGAVGIEKRDASLARDGLGQEGLAGTGRALEEHTLGDAELGALRAQLGRHSTDSPIHLILLRIRLVDEGHHLLLHLLPLGPLLFGLRDEHVGVHGRQVGSGSRDSLPELLRRLFPLVGGHPGNFLQHLGHLCLLIGLLLELSLHLSQVLHRPPREFLDEILLRPLPRLGVGGVG